MVTAAGCSSSVAEDIAETYLHSQSALDQTHDKCAVLDRLSMASLDEDVDALLSPKSMPSNDLLLASPTLEGKLEASA